MSERIQCCVPHCNHTRRNGDKTIEWICRDHWHAIPARHRRVYHRAKRQAKKGYPYPYERIWRLWERLKRYAIEKAAGIA